jgi:hypothetical protein
VLTASERAFSDDFRACSLEARCLYVRLVSRVGPCFRRRDLHYDEIADPDGAIAELAGARFLEIEPATEPAGLLRHLLRSEIEAIAAHLGAAHVGEQPAGSPSGPHVGEQLAGCPSGAVAIPARPPGKATPASGRATKATLIETLTAACPPDTLRAAILELVPLIEPLRLDDVTLYRLLFFGNLRQDLSELVLADLGLWRYESYELGRELRLFPDRAAIEDALAIRSLEARARACLEAGDGRGACTIAAQVAHREPAWHPTSRVLADGILLEVGHLLERNGASEQALELYSAATAPPARERCARLYARLGRERRAIALCREIADSPRAESERVFAARFEQRMRRRLGQMPPARRRYRSALRLVLAPDGDRAVESIALEHYASLGRDGFHAENWLWLALYGLAFWDVIYAAVPGAFEHAYQAGPLDLEEPAFRARRAGALDARLAEIDRMSSPVERLLGVWDEKRGIRNRLVPWAPVVRSRLELALSRLSGRHLATVLDRLSRDLGRYRRGLPDLFVVTPEEPGFVLFEVKGPGDRLRPEQVGWLDYLGAKDLPCAVLAVQWSTAAGGMRIAAVESPE